MEKNTAYNNEKERLYANIILPVKFRGEITYLVPDIYNLRKGSRVKVDFAGKLYSGIVRRLLTQEELSKQIMELAASGGLSAKNIDYKPILEAEPLPPVSETEISFWEQIAEYYMCSIGEVFKAAYPSVTLRQESVKPRKTTEQFLSGLHPVQTIVPPGLSPAQQQAYNSISAIIDNTSLEKERDCTQAQYGNSTGRNKKDAETYKAPPYTKQPQAYSKPVLLKGVTGSGKTEIYINLAKQKLEQGQNVLYMVPEIALSKQLYVRLKEVFGERLLTFHSKQTAAEKSRIKKILTYTDSDYPDKTFPTPHPGNENSTGSTHKTASGDFVNTSDDRRTTDITVPVKINPAVVVLGTRSALFLPYKDLGLIIVDEEHDTSYKQSDPAPRYHARDTAIMLAKIHKAAIIMGSATPSFESEYNFSIGKFEKVELNEKYYGATEPEVEIINTIRARKSRQMNGNFSQKLINEIKKTISSGGQVLIFRNRRSYSPVVECAECGSIPKCPHCNVYLSYHKYNNTLRCHYCDYTAPFSGICTVCGLDTVKYKGAGTEKLEEELKNLFPDTNISRYDADITKSKKAQEQVIKEFAAGETKILVGTQMISKGFDFGNLNLVVVIQAETILGIQDFRADEKALQLFSQLMGRTGRRSVRGKLIIQTSHKEHPVFRQLKEAAAYNGKNNNFLFSTLLSERKEFWFPPYVRMVKIIIKHRTKEKLDEICNKIAYAGFPCIELSGPFIPPIDKIRGEYLKCFYVKYARDNRLNQNKAALLKTVENIKGHRAVILDADP